MREKDKAQNQLPTPQELQNIWRNDPVGLSHRLFDSVLWSKQQEVLNAVRDYPRVAVKSGNTVGKSKTAAEVALGYLLSYYPSKVITTAPTFTQVEDILWKEIALLYNKAKVPIGGELLKTEIHMDEQWFAMGISTNEVNRFQGFHSPYLLVIIDEALGVDPMIWEAIEGLHPHRILAIGNPLTPEGEFFKAFNSPLWHKITISCLEAVRWQQENTVIPGLVTLEWCEERAKEWGVKSPLYQSRVLGEFPQEGTDTLIHLGWMDKCRENKEPEEEDAIKIVACDVARYGEDKTCIMDRIGHTPTGIEIKEKIPTTQTSGIVKRHYEREASDNLVIDDSGVGGGVTDNLVAQKIGVLAFNGGSKQKAIDKNRFKNLRSQFCWIVARKCERGMYNLSKLPQKEYEILKSQACSIKYSIDVEGRICVETKDDMKARGLNSPDVFDTFVMSEYAFWMGKNAEIKPFSYR